MKTCHNYFSLIIFALLVFLVTSCYYDNEEYLYPDNVGTIGCDTTNVTYSGTIAPLLANACNGCHYPASPFGAGIVLNNHTDLVAIINSGRFVGAINHASGFSPMPKGGTKLSDCNLLKIQKWIDDGALNN
jgi:hypothetical protein